MAGSSARTSVADGGPAREHGSCSGMAHGAWQVCTTWLLGVRMAWTRDPPSPRRYATCDVLRRPSRCFQAFTVSSCAGSC